MVSVLLQYIMLIQVHTHFIYCSFYSLNLLTIQMSGRLICSSQCRLKRLLKDCIVFDTFLFCHIEVIWGESIVSALWFDFRSLGWLPLILVFVDTYLTLWFPGISCWGRYGVMLPIRKASGTGVYPSSTVISMCLIQPSQMLFAVLDHQLAYTLLGTLSIPASFDKGQALVFTSYKISLTSGSRLP